MSKCKGCECEFLCQIGDIDADCKTIKNAVEKAGGIDAVLKEVWNSVAVAITQPYYKINFDSYEINPNMFY